MNEAQQKRAALLERVGAHYLKRASALRWETLPPPPPERLPRMLPGIQVARSQFMNGQENPVKSLRHFYSSLTEMHIEGDPNYLRYCADYLREAARSLRALRAARAEYLSLLEE